MSIKVRLKFTDILKVLCGGRVLVLDSYNNSVITVCNGKDTYVCK